MPRDDWRRADDRARDADDRGEFARDGKSSYPHLWEDDAPHGGRRALVPGDAPPRAVVVWCVCDHEGRAVATFPFAQKAEADTRARSLARAQGRPFYVERRKAPAD